MRTYLILKEKARIWNADLEIRALLEEINGQHESDDNSKMESARLPGRKSSLAKRRLPYERLDQITMEILLGPR